MMDRGLQACLLLPPNDCPASRQQRQEEMQDSNELKQQQVP